jgi:hypothetical protein
MTQTASARLAALKAEIKNLEQAALSELIEKRNSLTQQLAQVDAEIAELKGAQPERKRRGRASASTAAKILPLQELKELLTAAPDKTLGIRKENLDLQNIKALANANPHLLKLGGKGPWPTVTLLK